jgi:hypothetical protein
LSGQKERSQLEIQIDVDRDIAWSRRAATF